MKALRSVCAATLVSIAFVSAACGHGIVTDATSLTIPPTDSTKPPTGTVQRATLTVHVSIDLGDLALANTAGVTTAGLTVRLTNGSPTFAPRTLTTDASGTVRFENLLDGVYQVTTDRTLSAAELARLAPSDRDASIFAGGVGAVVTPPAPSGKEITLVANRRGSVVMSEIYQLNNPLTTNVGYGMGTYIEVYNNSDTTVYLDGMLMARTPLTLHGGWLEYPCAQYNQALRDDSTAITLTTLFQKFPGDGRNYPILPGEAKVVAMDAIDHNAAAPNLGQQDLSRADFEQYLTDADTDNPFSANMVNVIGGTGIFGRGYPYTTTDIAYVLLLPTPVSEFRTVKMVATYGTISNGLGQTVDVYSVARDKVLDVLSITSPTALSGTNQCRPFMSPAFERSPAPLGTNRTPIAIARKTIGRTPAGKEILQRTRTSERDFEYRDPLLRSLKKN